MTAKATGGELGWRLQAITVEEVLRDIAALGLIQASETPKAHQDYVDHSNRVREHIERLYRSAFDTAADDLSREAYKVFRHHKPTDAEGVLALFIILNDDFAAPFAYNMRQAAQKAYRYVETALADRSWGVLSDRASAFAEGRMKDLEETPNLVIEKVREEVLTALREKKSPSELIRRFDGALNDAREVEGKRVVETEATVTLGAATDAVMKAAGLTHKKWLSQRDDRVRHSHEECDKQGWIPIGSAFVNGLRYPGDSNGSVEELVNCRCVLLGDKK